MKKIPPLIIVCVTIVGVLMSIAQIVTGNWHSNILSQGKYIAMLGAVACICYALARKAGNQT